MAYVLLVIIPILSVGLSFSFTFITLVLFGILMAGFSFLVRWRLQKNKPSLQQLVEDLEEKNARR